MNIIDPKIVKEAAHWIVRHEAGDLTEREERIFKAWLVKSKDHDIAWKAACKFSANLAVIPNGIPATRENANQAKKGIRSRRESLRVLGLASFSILGATSLALVVPWKVFLAQQKTEVGATKNIDLGHGSSIVLNTNTSIDLDASNGEVWLREGQVLITTKAMHGFQQAISIQTPAGVAHIGKGSASIWYQAGRLRVAAIDGDVSFQSFLPQGGARSLPSGKALLLAQEGDMEIVSVDANDDIWSRGLIYANNTPLPQFVQELSRYCSGLLRCSPELKTIRISGVYRYSDLDQILQLLVDQYPVDIRKLSTLWVSIMPRQVPKKT